MSDTPTTEPAPEIDGGAAVEIPAQWEGMTDAEKDDVVDDLLTDVAERAGITGEAEPEEVEAAEPEAADEPRRFVDPDTVEE